MLEIGISAKINNTMANCVDPDETARYEPSHLDLHCLQKVSVLVCGDDKIKAYVLTRFSSRHNKPRNISPEIHTI